MTKKGFALGPGEGLQLSAFGSRIEKIGAEESGGWAFAIESSQPGFESPLHIHHTEDGAFFILEGVLFMTLGELEVEATPGTFVFMPKDVPHSFKVVSAEPARWVNVQGPTGDWSKMTKKLDALMKEGEVDMATRAALSKEHGLEIIRPAGGSG